MPLNTYTTAATIASGQSLSGGVLLGDRVLCAILMPAGWDAAALTFQVSDDKGVTWYELLDATGTAITVATPTAANRYEIDATNFKSSQYLKVRSGTSSAAVTQTASRVLTLVSRKLYPLR